MIDKPVKLIDKPVNLIAADKPVNLIDNAVKHASKSSNWTWLFGIITLQVAIYLVRSGSLQSVHSFIKDEIKSTVLLSIFIIYVLVILFQLYKNEVISSYENQIKYQYNINTSIKLSYMRWAKYIQIYIVIGLIIMSLPIIIPTIATWIKWSIINVMMFMILIMSFWSIQRHQKQVQKTTNNDILHVPIDYNISNQWYIILLVWFINIIIISNLNIIDNIITYFIQISANLVQIYRDTIINIDMFNYIFVYIAAYIIITMIYDLKTKQSSYKDEYHILIIIMLSILFMMNHQTEITQICKLGESLVLQDMVFTLQQIEYVQGDNHNSMRALVTIQNCDNYSNIITEKRFYTASNQHIYKTSIVSNLFTDVYIGISNGSITTGWMMKVKIIPKVIYLWIITIIFSISLITNRKLLHSSKAS